MTKIEDVKVGDKFRILPTAKFGGLEELVGKVHEVAVVDRSDDTIGFHPEGDGPDDVPWWVDAEGVELLSGEEAS